jgi:hypothetical protein
MGTGVIQRYYRGSGVAKWQWCSTGLYGYKSNTVLPKSRSNTGVQMFRSSICVYRYRSSTRYMATELLQRVPV